MEVLIFQNYVGFDSRLLTPLFTSYTYTRARKFVFHSCFDLHVERTRFEKSANDSEKGETAESKTCYRRICDNCGLIIVNNNVNGFAREQVKFLDVAHGESTQGRREKRSRAYKCRQMSEALLPYET